jgi:hydrogenase/urease accessory protein HupE
LRSDGATVFGEWDIALRDLEVAVGLDGDADGAITWGELKAKHAEVAAYAASRLRIWADDQAPPASACPIAITEQLVNQRNDEAYAVLRFRAVCSQVVRRITLDYRLLFDIDADHRGLIRFDRVGSSDAGIVSPERTSVSFTGSGAGTSGSTFARYFGEGAWHIWTGYDHLLFLIALLLPAVLAPSLRAACFDVAKIVTAFTLGHSLTLILAALGHVSLPARWVESAIALSVILAALNNIWPHVQTRRWIVACLFGLLHGFGFASALVELGLPSGAIATALVAFNVGVEAGQLAIVAVVLPLAYAIRHTLLYRRVIYIGGSFAVAALALIWLVERALDLQLITR